MKSCSSSAVEVWVSRVLIPIYLMLVFGLPARADQIQTKQESQFHEPPAFVSEQNRELVRPAMRGEPTEVQVGIFLLDVDELDSADQSFAASVYYEVRWQSPFLRHEGPGSVHRSMTDIWNPRPAISGLQMAWYSFPETVEIQPDGTAIYRQKVWGRFSQPLELRNFPFDQQQLSIHLVTAGMLQTVCNGMLLKKHSTVLVERMESRSRWAYPLLLLAILSYSFML